MYMLLGAALYYLPDLGIRGVRIDLIAELGRLVFVAAIPTLLMARVEGRPFGSYGLPRQGGFGKLFWGGAVWGIGALTILMLCMHWAGVFDFGSVVLHGGRLVKFAAFWGCVFLLVGLQEELLSADIRHPWLPRVSASGPALVPVPWLSAEFIS